MAQAFNLALRNICGFNAAAANAIVAQGYSSPSDLTSLDESDVDSPVKHTLKATENVIIPYNSVTKIKCFHYYAVINERIGLDTPPEDFDAEELDFIEALRKQRHARKDTKPTDKPPELKDIANWRTFWENFDAYMAKIYGAAEIPLTYVYREHDEVTQEMYGADYATSNERYYALTKLSGPHYEEDNDKVFQALKTALLNGPGWAFIRRFDATSDGQAAVKAIKAQAEGRSAEDTRKRHAYANIEGARYSGPRRNWDFQKYVQRHQEAHEEAEEGDGFFERNHGPASHECQGLYPGHTGSTKQLPRVPTVLGDTHWKQSGTSED